MKVEVWKSEHTGELFENEAAYLAHLTEQRAAQAPNHASRLEAMPPRERLLALQDLPFLHATSMDDLFARIVGGYPAVAALMVELELLHPSAALRRLDRIQEPASEENESIVLGPIGDVLVEFGGTLPDTTLGFCGKRTFVYEGPDSEGLVDEMVKAFPKLRAGCGLGDGEARVSYSEDVAHATSFICVQLEDTPLLHAMYAEYRDTWEREGEKLELERTRVFEDLLLSDSAYQGIADEIRRLSLQIEQMRGWRERRVYGLQAEKDRLRQEAVKAIPRLNHLETMRKTLCL